MPPCCQQLIARAGEVNHLTTWFGQAVELDGYFLEPAGVVHDVEAAGFTVHATLIRSPQPDTEYPSRRCDSGLD